MQLRKSEVIEVTISDIAFGGAGVGKMKTAEGGALVVFIEGTVPGDMVRARLTKIKKQYAEARLEEVIKPSEKRVTPRCKHFGTCGGCALQFLPYEEQLKLKEKFVHDALQRLGGIMTPSMLPILGCASPWFYRNKMEYSFGADGTIGLHPKGRFYEVFDLEECFLESELSVKIAHVVEAWGRAHGVSGFSTRTNSGVLKNLFVREGKNTDEVLVNLVTSEEFARPLLEDFKVTLARECPQITSCYMTTVTVKRGFRTVMKEMHLYGKKALHEKLSVQVGGKLHTLEFEILPQAFFQPNTLQAQVLYGKAVEVASPTASDIVYDLFCGTGTIGMFFSKCVQRVYGIELNKSAVENARENAAYNKIENISFVCGDVDAEIFKLAEKPTIVVVDPPRAGIAKKSLEKLMELAPPKIVYVSCNPSTLARDIKELSGMYELKSAQPVDLFPQTYHVECVCLLEKR